MPDEARWYWFGKSPENVRHFLHSLELLALLFLNKLSVNYSSSFCNATTCVHFFVWWLLGISFTLHKNIVMKTRVTWSWSWRISYRQLQQHSPPLCKALQCAARHQSGTTFPCWALWKLHCAQTCVPTCSCRTLLHLVHVSVSQKNVKEDEYDHWNCRWKVTWQHGNNRWWMHGRNCLSSPVGIKMLNTELHAQFTKATYFPTERIIQTSFIL